LRRTGCLLQFACFLFRNVLVGIAADLVLGWRAERSGAGRDTIYGVYSEFNHYI
jgi:hypothetical protein